MQGSDQRGGRGIRLTLAFVVAAALAVALAPSAGAYIYWARGTGGGIGRANNDGTDVRNKFIANTGDGSDCGVAVDSGHVYWVNTLTRSGASVGRANLDGTGVNPSFITATRSFPCGPAVDSQHIYWANRFDKSIARADITGANPDQKFIADQFLPCQVAVDDSHIYWAPGIMESNLDGTGVHTLVPGAGGCGVAVDSQHVYWVNQPDPRHSGSIGRANLDGTGAKQDFVPIAGDPCGLAVDGNYLYWMDRNFARIGRATLDGQHFDGNFIQTGAGDRACGIAVDQAGTGAGRLDLGRTSLNRSRGTAKLTAKVDGSGELKLRAKGHGIKRVSARTRGPDKVSLKVEARGRKQRLLRRRGRVKVEARVKFKSSNGATSTRHRKIELVRR